MTLIQQTEERIRELIPELKELSKLECNRIWEAWEYGTMSKEDFEFVLPDIMPHHILLAIEKVQGGWEYVITSDGYILELIGSTETGIVTYEGTGANYDFSKYFHEQSESTLQFIWDIIKEK